MNASLVVLTKSRVRSDKYALDVEHVSRQQAVYISLTKRLI